jgi:flagellar biosynthesis protein FlhA
MVSLCQRKSRPDGGEVGIERFRGWWNERRIPALIIATASGRLVTKATTQTSLSVEIGSQVAMNPRPLFVGALILLVLGLAPGLLMLPFAGLAALLYFGARNIAGGTPAPRSAGVPPAKPQAAKPAAEAPLDDFLQIDRATVEIGARLIPLVDPRRGNGLLDRIAGLRRDLARKNGIWVPPIRLRDNLQLEADAYRILVGGREVARGQLRPDRLLAIDPGESPIALGGEATKDPAFGLAARWISENDRQRAELGGYTVVVAGHAEVRSATQEVARARQEISRCRQEIAGLREQARAADRENQASLQSMFNMLETLLDRANPPAKDKEKDATKSLAEKH